ncbi:MAG: prephenate dehydrogenase/arogenate dehydrogenase family protein [Oscillospiraceae bacterium]|nr:prephenate dehydrogenase/arogenate dehydrogenase family protein [Oscillospiraceae bacterium]
MKIGIIGLGLIGGSLAKTIKAKTDAQVVGYDISPTTLNKALMLRAIDEAMDEQNLRECDMVLIALYPDATVDFIKKYANSFKKDAVIVDCCGVKGAVCEPLHDFCYSKKLWFIGGHPMAGREFSGFDYAKIDLFQNASMILTPYTYIPLEIVEQTKKFFLELGFNQVVITTPAKHDQMIAYTSQLAHVVSNAYVKSPGAQCHHGFSAGSYLDLTRVARLNETMWTELFLHNSEKLCFELDSLIEHLKEYREAIAGGDAETLRRLLREGRELKEATDPKKC